MVSRKRNAFMKQHLRSTNSNNSQKQLKTVDSNRTCSNEDPECGICPFFQIHNTTCIPKITICCPSMCWKHWRIRHQFALRHRPFIIIRPIIQLFEVYHLLWLHEVYDTYMEPQNKRQIFRIQTNPVVPQRLENKPYRH
jgi:hypothetical protein